MERTTQKQFPATAYMPPRIEITNVSVEHGFAASVGVYGSGSIGDWGDGGTERIDIY